MQSIIKSLKDLDESDYFKNVNLHIHTIHSDGIMSPDEVIENAKKCCLKIIAITDHNSIDAYNYVPYGCVEEWNLKILTGVEFDCWHKSNFLHILGYGFDINNKNLKSLCAKHARETKFDIVRLLNGRKAENVIKAIKDANGLAILAHPACCWNINLEKMVKELMSFGLDGMEVYYPYKGHRKIVKFYDSNEIKKIASKLNLLKTGGTDCHTNDLINSR